MPSAHFIKLMDSYDEVGCSTWSTEDFLESNLEVSRKLFTPESLNNRRPRPEKLEVYALLSGLSFEVNFTEKLVEVQRQISEILDDFLHYWVEPANFGVEYCVFKWPTDTWNEKWIETIKDVLASIGQASFHFNIGGVQINPDGCVVAKGFDEGAAIFQIRNQMKEKIPFLPAKQSGWAHVPLGRILEPIGAERFEKLAELINGFSDSPIATTEIKSLKFVHETRWYMEQKYILAEYPLVSDKKKIPT